jgi:hypothetical protein
MRPNPTRPRGELDRCYGELSLAYLDEAIGIPGVELRLHTTTLYNSIYRFDGDMLVNAHAYGSPAAQSPVLHLRHLPGG